MDANSFEVPTIPKIFVPQNPPNRSESQKTPKVSKTVSKLSNSEKEATQKDASSVAPLPQPPQLCASCSQILLSYFVPLQQYVNEVVELARTQQGVSPPALQLPNNDILSHVSNSQTSVQNNEDNHRPNESVGFEQNLPNNSQSGTGPTNIHSNETHNRIYNDLGNQSNINQNRSYQNQNHDPSQVNSHYVNQSYGNQTANYQNRSEANVDHYSNEDRTQSNEPQPQQQSHESRSEHSFTKSDGDGHQTQDYSDNRTTAVTTYSTSTHTSTPTSTTAQQIDSSDNYQNESTGDSDKPLENVVQQSDQSDQSDRPSIYGSHEEKDESQHLSISSPFAFVTIAYNNLSATNAIILANSLLLTNNKSMSYTDEFGNKNIIQVPFVILLGGSIDSALKEAIFMVFDEVITEPMDMRLALLNDESFGIQQYKLQLWKELPHYKKCLYLESSTMAVGRVTNLFQECEELSACVDWLFTDNFNCSVFVFEPNITTYEQIISFALFHQKCSAQKDESSSETLDEMTLLNQFFAHKWKRISFIYNFVRNDAIYTQIPAFMKYGDSIRIVNFGHMSNQSGGLSNQRGMTSTPPWHIMFDLLASNQRDVLKSCSVDNYSKFYLNCFIKRLWPILQTHLTPLLVNKYGIGRREWSIFELIRLLATESGMETNDHIFTQTPINLRRIKSPAEKISEYENLSIEDEEEMPLKKISDKLNANENESDSEVEEIESNPSSITEQIEDQTKELVIEEPMSPQQQDEISKREWEAGRIDWMGAHQSDKIINRLKKLIKND